MDIREYARESREITLFVNEVSRFGHSHLGNPHKIVRGNLDNMNGESVTIHTRDNSSVAYQLDTLHEGRIVTFRLSAAGTIIGIVED